MLQRWMSATRPSFAHFSSLHGRGLATHSRSRSCGRLPRITVSPVAMSRSAFDAVLGPKLRGAQFLDRLLPDSIMFVLFSSMGGIFGSSGTGQLCGGQCWTRRLGT